MKIIWNFNLGTKFAVDGDLRNILRYNNVSKIHNIETVEKIVLDQMQYLLGEYIKKGKLEGYYLSPGSLWFDIFSDKTYLCLKKPWF